MAKKETQAVLKQLKAIGYEEHQAQELAQKAQAKGFKLGGFIKLFRKLVEMFLKGDISLDDFFEQTGGGGGGFPTPARASEDEDDDDDDDPRPSSQARPVVKGARKLS